MIVKIQHRRGDYAYYDPTRVLPGELVVVQGNDPNSDDGKAIYIGTVAGDVRRLITESDLESEVSTQILITLQDRIDELIENIREEYSELSDDVDQLKNAFINDRTATSKSLLYPAYAHFTALNDVQPFYAKAGDKVLIWPDSGYPLTFTRIWFLDKNKTLVDWYSVGEYTEYKTISSGLNDIYYAYISNGTAQNVSIQNATTYYNPSKEINDLESGLETVAYTCNKMNRLVKEANLFNGNTHSGIHSQTNGQIYGTATSSDTYFYTDLIPIQGLESLYVFTNFIGSYTAYVTFFDADKKIIGYTNGNNQFILSFTTGAVYAVVCTRNEVISTLVVSDSIPTKYHNNNAVYSDNESRAAYKYKRLDRGIVNAYVTASVGSHIYPLTESASLICSYPVSLEGISAVSYRAFDGRSITVVYFDNTGKVISTESLTHNGTATLTIPNNAVGFVYYAGTLSPSKYCFVEGDVPPADIYGFDEIEIEGLKISNDYLLGKKIVFDGDSITEGAGVTDISTGIAPNNNKGWGYWVQQNHLGATVYGYGQSGWTVGKRDGYSDSLLNHISQYPEEVDLFVLSGGYNDQARQMAMGEIVPVTDGSDSYFNETFDQYTFCGALEYWFQQLRTNYPFAQIVYIITPKRVYSSDPIFNNDTKGVRVKDVLYSTGQQRMELFWQKIRDVCDKWAIKYLDFSKTSGVVGTGELTNPGLTIGGRYFSLSDGVPDFTHPNTNYYKKLLVPQIENLIRSVIY